MAFLSLKPVLPNCPLLLCGYAGCNTPRLRRGPPEHWGESGGADSGSGSIPAPPVSQLRWLALPEIPFLSNKSVSLCFQKGNCEPDTQKHVLPAGPMG